MSFNYRIIFKTICTIAMITGVSMFIPAMTAFFYKEQRQMFTFLILASLMILCPLVILHYINPSKGHIRMRDGYLIVSLGWITASVLGALPYIASGTTDSFIDAFFESMSAFTTTGATVFPLDTMPKSMLMWKGVSNWLGGMGILVLAISILPVLGIDSKTLAQAEVPGSVLNNVSNRISYSSKILYLIYIGFTLVEFVLLLVGPMDIFDAMINTMSSVSSSGMPSMDHAFTYYNSFYVEIIISIFTLLGAINFTLYYFILRGNLRTVFESIELRVFLLLIVLGSFFVVLNLYLSKTYGFFEALRYGVFQTISMSTTSGFLIIGYSDWPSFSLTIFTILMLIGGCSFSTCGGIKVMRVLVMFKLVARGFSKRMHPRSVVAVKIGGNPVSAQRVSYISVFIMLYLMIIVFGAIVLSLQNLDFITTLSSALAMISNIGIGLGDVATGDFSMYSQPLRLVLCFLMIAGRLELFTVITLFMPSFWNPDKYKNN